MDFSKVLIRSSDFYKLTVTPRDKDAKANGGLSATAKTFLRGIYRQMVFSRQTDISSKYLEHGIYGEGFAITMLSLHLKKMLRKNDQRLYNDFISGEPDVFIGKEITKSEEGFDTKCSWSIETLPFRSDDLDIKYYWQDMCYMWLTNAPKWSTAYCLVNHSATDIIRQKQNLWYKLGCDNSEENLPKYITGASEIERNTIYNKSEFLKYNPNYDFDCKDWVYDMEMEDRIRIYPVKRNEQAIELIKTKVQQAREYLALLHQQEKRNPGIVLLNGDNINGHSVLVAEKEGF